MTFNELIKSQTWLSVAAVLLALYPNQAKSVEGYEKVFKKLQTLQPVSIPLEIILSEHCDESFDEEPYTVVSGIELNNQSEGNSQTVGIEFVPWSEWLGMNIEKETQTNYTSLEIIAHCLFEMTFIGFNEDKIQNEMKL